jgi:hypothetical protein
MHDDNPCASILEELHLDFLCLWTRDELIPGEKRLERAMKAALEGLDLRLQPGVSGQRLKVESAAAQKISDGLKTDWVAELSSNPGLKLSEDLVGISNYPTASEISQLSRLFRGVLRELDLSSAQKVLCPGEIRFVIWAQRDSSAEGLEGLQPLFGGLHLML